ncbi:hypothetical protein H7K43_25890 [Streptomyces sp. TYQ1024]|nr:hypothetical protein [Streptomyces sp. TYQ1024]
MLDTVPRLSSPWPTWVSAPGGGLPALPPDLPLSRRQVREAASRCQGPAGEWQVLTDHQDWSCPPLSLPTDPAAWYQLAAIGGWQAVVADTGHAVAHDIVTARCEGRSGTTAAWCGLPFAVPVLCAAANGDGVQALQTAVQAALAEGLPLQRTVVALVCLADGRLPASVRAAITMLQGRVAAVVTVPWDPQIRVSGLRNIGRLKARTVQAGAELAQRVLDAAKTAWGDPLPPAPVPAALTAARSIDPVPSALEGAA